MSETDYMDNLFFNSQTEWKGTALDALGKGHTTFSYRLLQSKIEENEKLRDENAQLKYLLKEIRGKIHYINTPKNRHNIFDKFFIDKIDEALK